MMPAPGRGRAWSGVVAPTAVAAAGPVVCHHAAVELFTDGACLGNPGPGGWAWAEPGGAWASGFAERTTNQRMEIQAALEAVVANADRGEPIEIVSDSTYVVKCFTDGWWEGWQRRGWVNSAKKPVANRDLWEPLIAAVQAHGKVTFRWVKGHSGDAMNDLADRLAVQAAQSQKGRTGGAPPDEVGPADRPGPRSGAAGTEPAAGVEGRAEATPPSGRDRSIADEVVPVVASDPWQAGAELLGGWAVTVLGHRPDQLGVPAAADEDHPLLEALRDHLGDLVAERASVHDDLVVVSGLRMGAESLGAEAAIELGLPVAVVLPYPDPAVSWPAAGRARFDHLRNAATREVVLEADVPPDNVGKVESLGRRDAWLARFCDEALVVWDGRDVALGRLVRSLVDHLGEDQVVVVDRPSWSSPAPDVVRAGQRHRGDLHRPGGGRRSHRQGALDP